MFEAISTVIFDLDGVLLDTEPLYTQAIARLCARFGKHYDWELKKRTMGRAARLSAQITIEALALPLSVDAYLDERKIYLEELFQTIPDIPGVPELVTALAERGVRMAIATSSERRLCQLKLANKSWTGHIAGVVCGDDPEVTASKPAPDIFLAAARLLGAAPECCLVFEDSLAGVEAAINANMRVVAIPDPRHKGDPTFGKATWLIERYSELDLDQLGLIG